MRWCTARPGAAVDGHRSDIFFIYQGNSDLTMLALDGKKETRPLVTRAQELSTDVPTHPCRVSHDSRDR